MEDVKKNWETCPRCGSNRVEPIGVAAIAIAGVSVFGFGILLLIIPPVGFVFMIAGIALIALSPLFKNNLHCNDCKFSWKYPASQNVK